MGTNNNLNDIIKQLQNAKDGDLIKLGDLEQKTLESLMKIFDIKGFAHDGDSPGTYIIEKQENEPKKTEKPPVDSQNISNISNTLAHARDGGRISRELIDSIDSSFIKAYMKIFGIYSIIPDPSDTSKYIIIKLESNKIKTDPKLTKKLAKSKLQNDKYPEQAEHDDNINHKKVNLFDPLERNLLDIDEGSIYKTGGLHTKNEN